MAPLRAPVVGRELHQPHVAGHGDPDGQRARRLLGGPRPSQGPAQVSPGPVGDAAEEHLRLDHPPGIGQAVDHLAGGAVASHRHHHALAVPRGLARDVDRLAPARGEDRPEVAVGGLHRPRDAVEVTAGAAAAAGRVHDEKRSQDGLRPGSLSRARRGGAPAG